MLQSTGYQSESGDEAVDKVALLGLRITNALLLIVLSALLTREGVLAFARANPTPEPATYLSDDPDCCNGYGSVSATLLYDDVSDRDAAKASVRIDCYELCTIGCK